MKCYENFSMFQDSQTPFGHDAIPDQMKPIAQKNSRHQNFDIILNKYFNNNELTDIQLQQLSQHQKIVVQEVQRKLEAKTKRPDEYQKMFFKKAFKYAEHAFFKKNKKNRSRRMSQFYHHHFDNVAKKLKIPLINFYHPEKKTKPGLSTGQKSFNYSYVRTILKSISFRKICSQYHQRFKQECRKQRNKKIMTFSSSIFSLIERNKDDIRKSIRFLQSSKCKIPWTDKDIDEAYQRAAEQLDQFHDKQESGNSQSPNEEDIIQIYQDKYPAQIDEQIQELFYNDQQAQEITKSSENKIIIMSQLFEGSQLKFSFAPMQI